MSTGKSSCLGEANLEVGNADGSEDPPACRLRAEVNQMLA
jgi:hypothetical protein